MIKKFKEFVNEDFTDLYKRWKDKEVRKEDGTKIKTKYGEILLKEPKRNYKDLIQIILDMEYNNICYIDVVQNMGLSSKERNEISNYKNPYIFPLEDLTHGGLVVSFDNFEDANEECRSLIDEEFCEDDYKEIIKCISVYLKDNVKIVHTNLNFQDYKILLYSGYLKDDFYMDNMITEFEDTFNTDIHTWSFQYEINIGVDITKDNVDRYADMKKFIESYVEEYE